MILYIVKYSMQYANAMLHSTYCYASAMHTYKAPRPPRSAGGGAGCEDLINFRRKTNNKSCSYCTAYLKDPDFLEKTARTASLQSSELFSLNRLKLKDFKLILTRLFKKYF